MTTADIQRDPSRFEKVVAGLSLVIIVSYAPFAIAALLADHLKFVPLGFLVAMVLLSMAVGTLLSAKLTNTGLVVAPAVGMAGIVKDTKLETLSTSQFLLATIIAGAIAIWLSRPREGGPSLRQVFLNSLPRPVLVGVRGGVGALLAAVAAKGIQEVKNVQEGRLYQTAVIIFVGSVIILLISEIIERKLEQRSSSRGFGPLLARIPYVVLPLATFIFLYREGAFPLPSLSWSIQFPCTLPLIATPVITGINVPQLLVFLCFTTLILFISLTDIPGSVYDLLQRKSTHDPTVQQQIDQSFLVTSGMSTINPVFGLFTSVYYAENYVVIRDKEVPWIVKQAWTAWFCGLVFLACAAAFLFVQFPVTEMKIWLLVAVAPALFCVGITLTARAMHRDFAEELEQRKSEGAEASSDRIVAFFIPVALTVVLTHFVGFELALPSGIIYYGLSMMVVSKNWRKECGDHFLYLCGLSCVIAVVIGLGRLQALHKPTLGTPSHHPVCAEFYFFGSHP